MMMKRLVNKLLGDAGLFSFEQRIFHFTILMALFITLFGTVIDIAYYHVEITADTAFLCVWALVFSLSRYANRFRVMSVFGTLFFVFLFLPFYWITNGGSEGMMPYYTLVFVAAIGVILKGRLRLFIVAAMMAVVLLLIGYDILSTAVLPNASLYRGRYINIGIHMTVMLAAMGVLLTVYSNTYLKERARSEEYLKTIEEQYQQQLYYMKNLENLIDKLKSERHDFSNHLGVMYGLLELGDAQSAKGYAAGLVKTAQEYQTLVSVPYAMIRAMLNYKLSIIRESRIPLKLSIDIPRSLNLNEFDITVILGNLLDNAMEAVLKMEEAQRYISLAIAYNPQYLVIRTENPVKAGGDQPGSHSTTKPDTQNHGYGLKNIEYLVEKHNGFIKAGQEEGIFTADVALLVSSQD